MIITRQNADIPKFHGAMKIYGGNGTSAEFQIVPFLWDSVSMLVSRPIGATTEYILPIISDAV